MINIKKINNKIHQFELIKIKLKTMDLQKKNLILNNKKEIEIL